MWLWHYIILSQVPMVGWKQSINHTMVWGLLRFRILKRLGFRPDTSMRERNVLTGRALVAIFAAAVPNEENSTRETALVNKLTFMLSTMTQHILVPCLSRYLMSLPSCLFSLEPLACSKSDTAIYPLHEPSAKATGNTNICEDISMNTVFIWTLCLFL